jgi:hypothetical protein
MITLSIIMTGDTPYLCVDKMMVKLRLHDFLTFENGRPGWVSQLGEGAESAGGVAINAYSRCD